MKLGLTPEQLAERRKGLGGSDANILMNGDPAAILALWEEKTGRREPEDLSRVLPVQLGLYTEPFNVHWYKLTTGRPVEFIGRTQTHRTYPFMRVTLDGMTTTEDGSIAVFEAKHVNAFSKIEDVVQRYMPQLHHNMAVTEQKRSVLSVLLGTMAYEIYEVPCDDWYLAQLIDRERAFWACVTGDTPPPGMEAVRAPMAPVKFRAVDMSTSNAWASHAADWRENRDAAKAFAKAEKEIKALIEPDVGRAFGHGIECKRDKAGRLSIKEVADAAE